MAIPDWRDIRQIYTFFQDNLVLGLGIIITIIFLYVFLSEFRGYLRNKGSPDGLVLSFAILLTGITMVISQDALLAILLGIMVLMVHQTYSLRDTPVWRELMIASTATYGFILGGKILQIIYIWKTGAPESDERIFGLAFNLSFYVFIIIAFIFFGKKFILVSRFSSPQMVYLGLFGLTYVVILKLNLRNFDYLYALSSELVSRGIISQTIKVTPPYDRLMFATFGTFEALFIVSTFLYLISGWLLSVLFGVKEIDDPRILRLVDETAKTLGIKQKVRVGYVRAPILNAFAYGPFYDLRVAFISSDLETFTDDDVRGIVAHELAHSVYYHVPLLLLLTAVELGIKKALNLPATTLDYATFADNPISFVSYYIFNSGLLVILLIFVRILEGHADHVTSRAGLGIPLSKALYRLEGFYQGVASDFGISVNLLTDREYSEGERIRFSGEAAIRIYQETLSPTKGAAFSNIFVSHPRTSYRIAAVVDPDITPLRAALLPYFLLFPRSRKKYVKKLKNASEGVRQIINSAYLEDFTSEQFRKHLKSWPKQELLHSYLEKDIIAISVLSSEVVQGKVVSIFMDDKDPCSPAKFVIKTVSDEETTISFSEWMFEEAKLNETHFLKNGELVTLLSVNVDPTEGLRVEVERLKDNKHIILNYLPKHISILTRLVGQKIYFYDGHPSYASIKTIEKPEIMGSIKQWKFVLSIDSNRTVEVLCNNLIIGFSPVGFDLRSMKHEQKIEFLSVLRGHFCSVFSKDNFDVPFDGRVLSVENDSLTLDTIDGNLDLSVKRIDYVVSFESTVELITKDSMTALTQFQIWWSNRSNFDYVS